MLKGVSFPVNHSAKLILGVLVLAVGVMAINNINQNSLNPNRNSIEAVLDSFTPTEVDIGGKHNGNEVTEEEAIKQMEGLIAFNMLVAADCRLTESVKNNLSEPNVGYFDGFEKLIEQTDFNGDKFCANNLDFNPVDEGIRKFSPFRAEVTGPTYDNEGRQGRTKFEINQTFELNRGETNNLDDETLVGYRHDNPNSDVLSNQRAAFPGFWNGARNAVFLPAGLTQSSGSLAWGSDGSDNPIKNFELQHDEAKKSDEGWGANIGNKAKYESGDKDKWKVGTTPWGQEGGFLEDDATEGFKKEVGGNPQPEWRLYTYRPRFKNVPLIMKSNPEYLKHETEKKKGNYGGYTEGEFELFVEELRYRFCDGSNGYVQTNAQQMDSGGEANASVSYAENAVYPLIEITDNKFGDNPQKCVRRKKDGEKFLGFRVADYCDDPHTGSAYMSPVTLNGEDYKRYCRYKKVQNLHDYGMGFKRFRLSEPVYRTGFFIDQCPGNGIVNTPLEPDKTTNFENNIIDHPPEASDLNEGFVQFNNMDDLPNNVRKLKFSFTPEDDWDKSGPPKLVVMVDKQIKDDGQREAGNPKLGKIDGKGKFDEGDIRYQIEESIVTAGSSNGNTITNKKKEWTIEYLFDSKELNLNPSYGPAFKADISGVVEKEHSDQLEQIQFRVIDKNGDETGSVEVNEMSLVRDLDCTSNDVTTGLN